MSSSLATQHLLFSQLLLHMRDQIVIFEDGEDFLGQPRKVIFITFVSNDAVLREDWSDV